MHALRSVKVIIKHVVGMMVVGMRKLSRSLRIHHKISHTLRRPRANIAK